MCVCVCVCVFVCVCVCVCVCACVHEKERQRESMHDAGKIMQLSIRSINWRNTYYLALVQF